MSDDQDFKPDEREEREPGTPEGVRIIGAQEAAEALERGDVARRRPDDMPRYGDRPTPPPEGSRPTLRFPLSESTDPREVSKPPLAGAENTPPASSAPPPDPNPPSRYERPVFAPDADDFVDRTQAPPPRPEPTEREEPAARPESPLTEAGPDAPLPLTPAATSLPHWSDPPTGEVPKILPDRPPPAEGEEVSEEDFEAWSSFATQAPRWRDQPSDWDKGDFDDMSSLADDSPRLGALDETRAPVSDLFVFDDPEPEPEPTTRQIRTGGRMSMAGTTQRERGTADRNLPVAVGTGVAVAAVALALFSLGPGYAMIIVTAVITVAAVELFTALRGIGYSPATLLGIVATGALVLASYWRGEAAYPLVLFLLVVFGLLWYLTTGPHEHITTNLGATVLAVAWVGVLGAFAALMLGVEEHGVGLLLGCILCTVAYDVGGLFIGGSAGRAPLAPSISPNKTVEGLAGGMAAALLVGVLTGFIGLTPWDSAGDGFMLGLVVAIAAPLGDLSESLIKRDLGIKDMGTLLPGHGGVLDRFDAMLFALPATYYLARMLDLVVV